MKQSLDYLKVEHNKVEKLMRLVRARERSLNTSLKICDVIMQAL